MAPRLFPVVCAASLSKEVMNRFIKNNDIDDDQWFMVFVDKIDNYYDEESQMPVESDSDPNSPFIGKTPEECHELLLKLVEDTESEVTTNYFAIMDERSTKDDTVLLVSVERNDGGENEVMAIVTVRAAFEVAATALACYNTGHSSVAEDLDCASREKDHVFRGR